MSKAVKKVTKAVTKVVSKAAKAVSNAVSNVVNNPLPVIETIALTAVLGPAGAGLSTATAATVSSAAVSAANGGNVKDIATAAATGYVGGKVAGYAGQATQTAGYSQAMAQIAASASGASVSGTLQGLAQGQSLDQALQLGFESGLVSGATTASVSGIKSALAQGPQQAGEARFKVPAQGNYQIGGDIGQVPQQIGFTDKVPTGGGVGFVANPSVLYSSRFAPTQAVRLTDDGRVQQAYQTASSLITPAGLSQYNTPYTQRREFVSEPLSSTQEKLLSEALGTAFGSFFEKDYGGGTQTTYAAADTKKPTPLPVGQYAPGSQALAQALRIGDVGAPIFGADDEKSKKAGWNVESLRYMGDVGEA